MSLHQHRQDQGLNPESGAMTGTIRLCACFVLSCPLLADEYLKCTICMQNIALSPVELGDLIETINGGQSGKAIYHDPNKGRTGYVVSKCPCYLWSPSNITASTLFRGN